MKFSLVALLAISPWSDAARILAFYPSDEKSHHFIFRPIMAALAKKGHQVVYYTGYPYEGTVPPGIVQMDLSDEITPLHSLVDELIGENSTEVKSLFADTKMFFDLGLILAESSVATPTVQKLIHADEEFDAVMMESYFIQEYQSAFLHKFDAIGIETLTLGGYSWSGELMGFPDNPAFQLDIRAQTTRELDFWQRLYNTYVSAIATFLGYYHMTQMKSVTDRYFNYTGWESRPSLVELVSNRSIVLTNSHFAVGYPAPSAPHCKEIGGVNILSNQPLRKDVQTFMDEGKDGVIILTLGTNINVSDPSNSELHDTFMKVFAELPQRVLMKWETNYPGKLPKNFKLLKWLPQQDLLAHNNCALFITHGGYLSLTEAVYNGVPVVGIPFFADQPRNLHFVEDAGIGKMLSKGNITYESVATAVKEVLTNKRYKEEMMKRSKMFRDRPLSAVDEAVYWIEHSLRYPNVLTPQSVRLSFIQLHLIDVKLFIIFMLSIAVLVVYKLLWIMYKHIYIYIHI